MNDTAQQTQTVAQAMAAAQIEAKQKVNELIWSDAEPAQIATAALSGGLTSKEVGAIETGIHTTKTELKTLAGYNTEQLSKASEKAELSYEAADITFKAAEEIREQAGRECDLATRRLEEARRAFNQAAAKAESGKIPLDKMPPSIISILNYKKITTRIMWLSSNDAKLKDELRTIKGKLEGFQKLLFVQPKAKAVIGRVKTIKAELKTLEAGLSANTKEEKERKAEAVKLKKLTIL